MTKNRFEPAVTVYRGDGVEAVHHIAVAVVNNEGRLTHYVGDPSFNVMTRSSIKPFQLMPLVASGAAEKFGFSNEQLSIMCGSHNGTDKHREVVQSNLALAGNTPADLQCGSHWPIGMQPDEIFPQHGEEKDPLRHNCSGKHSGFLALARYLNEDVASYLDPQSKTQKMVKQALADFCQFDPGLMKQGIDGCSAPNYSLSLQALAYGYMKLANGLGTTDAEKTVAQKIRSAIWEFPYMVSGDNRFDYDLKRSFPNNALCKVGAEAVEAFGFAEPSIGIAIKIADGNWRALWPVCVEVLKQLGLIKNGQVPSFLQKHEKPEVLNVRKIVTGHIITGFDLKKI